MLFKTCGKLAIIREKTIFPLCGLFKGSTAENWIRITKMPKREKQITERPRIVKFFFLPALQPTVVSYFAAL